MDPQEVDQKVQALNSEIAPKIDCTACGNCCKTLLININEKEADALSEHLEQTREIFDKNYLEKGMNGALLISAVPCHFLHDNKYVNGYKLLSLSPMYSKLYKLSI
jgi:Fe-S-cluster containining protein